MNELKNALLAFFLALGGHAQPAPPPDASVPAPSALVAEHRPLTAGLLVGAWRGTRLKTGERTPSVMEATLVDTARSASLLGYFTFGEGNSAPTVRRLGHLKDDRLTFTMQDGAEMTLELDQQHMRLLGRERGTAGEAATFELARVRPRPR